MIPFENERKNGWINIANVAKDLWNHGYKIVIHKCIQPKMKESLLSLEVLLQPKRTKFTNKWLQYQNDEIKQYVSYQIQNEAFRYKVLHIYWLLCRK